MDAALDALFCQLQKLNVALDRASGNHGPNRKMWKIVRKIDLRLLERQEERLRLSR